MPVASYQLLTCPKCRQTLPSTAMKCQFCGAAVVQNTPGFTAVVSQRVGLCWQEVAYIVCCILVCALGVWELLQGMKVVPSTLAMIGGADFLTIWGVINLCLGLALLAQQTWAQFIMKYACVLFIVIGIGSLLLSLLLIGTRAFSPVAVVSNALNIAFYGLFLYLINFLADV